MADKRFNTVPQKNTIVSADRVILTDSEDGNKLKQVPATAFVGPQGPAGSGGVWGSIAGTLSSQTDLQNALNLKANIASPTFTGTVTVPTPTNSTDAVTKSYADNLVLGLSWKAPVKVATTTNGTLATAYANGQVVNGVTLVTGDRILIKDQTIQTENGIYTVNASGSPTRATDADTGAELVQASVFVSEGTVGSDIAYTCTNNSITIGSTNIVFVQFNGSSTAWGGITGSLSSQTDLQTALDGKQNTITTLPIANGGTGQATAVASIDALSTQGADIASAATTNLATATGQFVNITGTTTITAFGTAAAGVLRDVVFTGILTLTHNATSLILPTAANIVTAAGDTATLRSLGSGNWRVVSYDRASGAGLVSSVPTFNGVSCFDGSSTNYTTTDTAVTFTTEEFDTNNYHDNVTNTSRFSAPSTGYYKFSWKRTDDLFSGSGVQVQMKVKKNGSTNIQGTDESYSIGTSAGYRDPSPVYNEVTVSLNSGDYLELIAYATANTTVAYSGIRVQMQNLGA